jgi:flagellar protein FliO/FliZ
MLESLFGAETPLAVRFFVAFIVVFALIGVVAWLVRRFGSGALGSQGARGRAPRLAVIEAGSVDGRRKLVLIRRDNVEHLIMIGGPTDIVIEPNIVRGQNAREVAAPRGTGVTEALPRAVPMAEDTSSWPLQPEVAPRPARAARPAPAEDNLHWPTPPEPKAPVAPVAKRTPRASDTLAGLAAELSARPAPPEPELAPVRAAPKIEPRVEAPKIEPRIEPRVEPKPEPKIDIKPEPKVEARTPQPQPASADSNPDHNLADMAQRLEAALRRPGGPLAPASTPAAAPAAKPAAEKPVAPERKPAPAAKPDNVFGSLEEEMASLLGRPPGKT